MKGLIDIHCHIVPGVDDGPKDLVQAIDMIELMYRDGIRGAIATSHYNHIIDFKPSMSYGESLEMLRERVSKDYPDFEIYSGAEFRVRENYLEVIDSDIEAIALNNTPYVLIEFQDDINRKRVLDVLYEIRLRGYLPIIAHVERYGSIYEDEHFLKQIKQEGAYLQVSARAITERWSDYRKFKRLLKKGYFDFIASDGHSARKRPPLLREAYQEVSRIYSVEFAKKIFIENPKLLLSGEALT